MLQKDPLSGVINVRRGHHFLEIYICFAFEIDKDIHAVFRCMMAQRKEPSYKLNIISGNFLIWCSIYDSSVGKQHDGIKAAFDLIDGMYKKKADLVQPVYLILTYSSPALLRERSGIYLISSSL